MNLIENHYLDLENKTLDGELIDLNTVKTPLDLSVIPNYMGINLCSVKGMRWNKLMDGQLVDLTIEFIPS